MLNLNDRVIPGYSLSTAITLLRFVRLLRCFYFHFMISVLDFYFALSEYDSILQYKQNTIESKYREMGRGPRVLERRRLLYNKISLPVLRFFFCDPAADVG